MHGVSAEHCVVEFGHGPVDRRCSWFMVHVDLGAGDRNAWVSLDRDLLGLCMVLKIVYCDALQSSTSTYF
jgi:hypothetical protein